MSIFQNYYTTPFCLISYVNEFIESMKTSSIIASSLLTFSCHLIKSSLPMYFVHFILTTNYWTPHKYALLLSLLTFASMTTPLYIGYRFDTLVNHHQMLVLILLIGITIGQGLFVLTMLLNQNIYFYYSVIIIGLSSSSLVVIQSIITHNFF